MDFKSYFKLKLCHVSIYMGFVKDTTTKGNILNSHMVSIPVSSMLGTFHHDAFSFQEQLAMNHTSSLLQDL